MPHLPSNINELIRSIEDYGTAFNNRYSVAIYPPKILASGKNRINDTTELLSLRCEAITIPGKSVSTTPYRYYGPARNMPYEPIYAGELNMTFLLSENFMERTFFERWMSKVCSDGDYKLGYYDDYTSSMDISVLGRNDKIIHEVKVEEIYPKAIGDIQLGYEKDNEVMRQDITMCFRKYTTKIIETVGFGIMGRNPSPTTDINLNSSDIPSNIARA